MGDARSRSPDRRLQTVIGSPSAHAGGEDQGESDGRPRGEREAGGSWTLSLDTPFCSVALFGGIYNNALALEAVLEDLHRREVEAAFCLGDLGGFGPHPDRVFPLLREGNVVTLRGNYDHSLARGLEDCGCGYADPRDNWFAQVSYDYTFQATSEENKRWLGTLPTAVRLRLGPHGVHLCHGSPRRMNEFLWESTTPDGLLRWFFEDDDADILCFTHTGIKWHRTLAEGRHAVNVGVIGRPENDGTPRVWYTILRTGPEVAVEFVPVEYDHERLAWEMEEEGLPAEFVETVRTGWWTTCMEILPAKERKRGKY